MQLYANQTIVLSEYNLQPCTYSNQTIVLSEYNRQPCAAMYMLTKQLYCLNIIYNFVHILNILLYFLNIIRNLVQVYSDQTNVLSNIIEKKISCIKKTYRERKGKEEKKKKKLFCNMIDFLKK